MILLSIPYSERSKLLLALCMDCRYTRPPTDKPYAGIVWSGKGTLNGAPLDVDVSDCKEFLVVPGTPAEFCNTGDAILLVYTAWPIVSRE